MNKHNKKPLVLSSLLALAFGSMSVAGTFALFTDKAETQINIEAGKVQISQSLSIVSVSELGGVGVNAVNSVYTSTVGSKTYFDEDDPSLLHLENWVPGDKAILKVSNYNSSNVDIKTRFRVTHTSTSDPDLWEALTKNYSAVDGNNVNIGYKFQDWSVVKANTSTEPAKISDVTVTIEFKDHDNGQILFGDDNQDNDYQNCNCTIRFIQEAVQANAHTDSLLDQLNLALDNAAALNGRNKTMYDALQDVAAIKEEADLASIGYVWGVNDDHFHYAEEGTTNEYFKIYSAMPNPQTNSIYAASNWNVANVNLNGVGFDAGSATGIASVNYTGILNTARTNTIRTNSLATSVNVEAPLDTISHYGNAGSLVLNAIAGNSYHENGRIAFAEIKNGRMALEKGAEVEQIHLAVTGTGEEAHFNDIVIAKDEAVDMPKISRDPVTIPDTGRLVVALQEGTEKITEQTELDYVWLTAVGVYEQVTLSESNAVAGSDFAANSTSNEKKNTAQQIANNITFSDGGVDYKVVAEPVIVNEVVTGWNYDVVKEDGTAAPAETYTATAVAATNTVEVEKNNAAIETVVENGITAEEKAAAIEEKVEEAAAAVIDEQGKAEDKHYVARIGFDRAFETLEAALDAAVDGETIVLLDNVEIPSTIEIAKSVIFNLSNYKLINRVSGGRMFTIRTKIVDVTFKAGKNGGMEMYDGFTQSYGLLDVGKYGDSAVNAAIRGSSVSFIGGSYVGYTDEAALIKGRDTFELNMEGVTMENNYEIISLNDSSGLLLGALNLKDCNLHKTGADYAAIYAGDYVSTIRNCRILTDGKFASEFGGGMVDIYDSTFMAADGTTWEYSGIAVSYGCVANVFDCTMAVAGHAVEIYSSGGEINIYGGTYIGGTSAMTCIFDEGSYGQDYDGAAINVYGGSFTGGITVSGNKASINLEGGEYSVDPSARVAAGFAAYQNELTNKYEVRRDELLKVTPADPTLIAQSDLNGLTAGQWVYVDHVGEVHTTPNLNIPAGVALVGAVDEYGDPVATLIMGKYATNNYYIFSNDGSVIENFHVRAYDGCDQGSGGIFQQNNSNAVAIYRNLDIDMLNASNLKCMTAVSLAGGAVLQDIDIVNSYNGIRINAGGVADIKMMNVDIGVTEKTNTLTSSAAFSSNVELHGCSFARYVNLNKVVTENQPSFVAIDCHFKTWLSTNNMDSYIFSCKIGTYGADFENGNVYVSRPTYTGYYKTTVTSGTLFEYGVGYAV